MKKQTSKNNLQKKSIPGKNIQPVKKSDLTRYYYPGGIFIIILLGVIIYSNSFYCSFHFDDYRNIVENTSIRDLADIKAWMNFFPTRPVGVFTFAVNYHFSQLNIWPYHFVNLVIHLINSCLTGWLTLLIFSSPALKDHPVTRYKYGIAFFTALLFVSHPLATQSVTYIVQRMAALVALFYLLSLALYMKARLSTGRNSIKYLFFAGSFLSLLLALL